MVQEINFEGKSAFKCMKCGWMYRDKDWAKKCENWCTKHKSCNLKIAKYAIKV